MKVNRKFAMMCFALLAVTDMSAAQRYTFTFEIGRTPDQEAVTECKPNASFFQKLYGLGSADAVLKALKGTTFSMAATYTASSGKEAFYKSSTSDKGTIGHWFAVSGSPTNKAASKTIQVQMDGRVFSVTHNPSNVEAGKTYEVKETFIKSGADTLTYVFRVTIGDKAYVIDNQPVVIGGRKNYVDSWRVTPRVKANDGDWLQQNYVQVNEGEAITLSAVADADLSVKYSWLNSSGKTIQAFKKTADYVISDATASNSGMYTLKMRMTDAEGKVIVENYNYFVDVQKDAGKFYDWPANTATFSYNFKEEYPDFPVPQKTHNIKKQNGRPANVYSGEWWSAHWGDKLNPSVGQDSATVYQTAENMVNYFEKEFAYIRDVMGWPPDLNAREGWKSYIYIFGSGLEFDADDSTATGGFQGWYTVDGFGCPCVTCSYLPFSRYRSDADNIWGYSDSEWQRSAMIHEGIHAILATMKGVKGSAWFHEAGNTWLQGKMAQMRGGGEVADDARAGWLDGGPFLAPFMPIECYSGWLQDGSFGGPAAEGVNRYNENGQICTWRRYLGGTQYGNSFPYILSSFCGNGSVPWIWNNCEGRVLEGIGNYVGDEAMRKIILQYRSRMAIYDFDGYKSYRNTCSDNFGGVIGPEYEPYWIKCADWTMTPYQKPELNDAQGWLAPDTITNPGWSGANFIPIHVDPNSDVAEVEFRPEDTHMMAQLCYRTKTGTAYYSQPVHCGKLSIDISDRPANGVIICVVANTDYIYTGDEQRQHHWDYRIRLGEGSLAVADIYKKWFYFEQNIIDNEFVTGIQGTRYDIDSKYNLFSKAPGVKPAGGMVLRGHDMQLNLSGVDADDVSVRMVGLSGVVAANGRVNPDGSFAIPSNIPAGMYVLTFDYNGKRDSHKVIVK